MDIIDIRRNNMIMLLNHFKTQSDFAGVIDTSPAYISQIKKGTKKTGERVAMGDELARSIENKLGLEHGWMDQIQKNIPYQIVANNNNVGGDLWIGHNLTKTENKTNVTATTGIDFFVDADSTKIITSQPIEYLLPNLNSDLVATIAIDSLMQPIINEKAIIIADKKIAEQMIRNDKIYLMDMNGLLVCRYLQRLSGEKIRVFSETYKDGETLIRQEFDDNYKIIGGVVAWINSVLW